MGARELLDDLHGAGLAVALIDNKIIVTPKARLTDPMRDAIRAHRTELVEALKPEPAPAAPTARIFRLTRAQGEEAHTEAWSDYTIGVFTLRRDAFLRRGYATDDANDLAERLALRDRDEDDRRMCIECSHLGERGRCLAAGRLPGADPRLEPVPTILQRCEAFGLRKGFT